MIGRHKHKDMLRENVHSTFSQCISKINDIRSDIIDIVKNNTDKHEDSVACQLVGNIKDGYGAVKSRILECKEIYKHSSRALPDVKGRFNNRVEYLSFQIKFLESALDMAKLLKSLKSDNSELADRLIDAVDSSQFIPDFYIGEENRKDNKNEQRVISEGDEEEPITGENEKAPVVIEEPKVAKNETKAEPVAEESKKTEEEKAPEVIEEPEVAKNETKAEPVVTEEPKKVEEEKTPAVVEDEKKARKVEGEEAPGVVECNPEIENEKSDIYKCMEKINTLRENTIIEIENMSKIPNQTDMYQISILDTQYNGALHKQIQECNTLLDSNLDTSIKPIKEYFPNTLGYLSFQVHYFETGATMGNKALALNAHSHSIADAVITFVADSNFIYGLEQ